ncbi:MAG: hypothetical protein J6333_00505 [Planctomycetes bacterium]|nr:hypothetical protein [Planctomycetota bacterium]
MCLLITVFCAVAATVAWYASASARQLKVSVLCWLFWGASLMWFVDAVFEYSELGAKFFTPAPEDMLNDAFLGLAAAALALVIWVAVMLVSDPRGVIREALLKKSSADAGAADAAKAHEA